MVRLVVVSVFVWIALAVRSIVVEWIDVAAVAAAAAALDLVHIELSTLKSYF